MHINKFLIDKRPICAICNKKVETFEVKEDLITRGTIFTAYCHGEEEITSLSLYQTTFMSPECFEPGYAFKKNNLLE